MEPRNSIENDASMRFKQRSEKEIRRFNRLQQERFDLLVDAFDPPLPEGVPERLKQIVAAAEIVQGASVLDVGTGSGILIPLIQEFDPESIYACDLSKKMLKHVQRKYPGVKTLWGDVREISLPNASINVVFINACFANIADKNGMFRLLARILRPAGRVIISHPLGKSFIDTLKPNCPYPLDDFPGESKARRLLNPFGFDIRLILDEPHLYLLIVEKRR